VGHRRRRRVERTQISTGATAPSSPLAHTALSDAQADELRAGVKALADRHRVKIRNRAIAAGDDAVCVCEFTDTLGASSRV
jgi:hypothetical protein